jgi:hypothetical protein
MIPDREFTIKLLNLYGIEDFTDNHFFIKNDLDKLNTIDKLNDIKDLLSDYYIPCKSKVYLENITLKRCIVILRHFLKCHDYNIYSKEKFIKGIKYTTYRVVPQTDGIIIPDKTTKVIVSFD